MKNKQMMVVDTSAVVAILEGEDDADFFIGQLQKSLESVMSAAIFVELGAVMKGKRGGAAIAIVDEFIKCAEISIEPVSAKQAIIARDAYTKYGILNYGDVFSYALAKDTEMPLLFKGNDFTKTDIKKVT